MKHVAIALMLAAVPGMAAAQTPACVPQDQAAALVTFALPTMVEQLANRCTAELPPSAYLIANATRLAERYRGDSTAAWPVARKAIAGLFTQFLGQPMPAEMNSDMVRTLAEPMLGGMLAKQIDHEDCGVADRAITDVAQLSGRAIGRLAVLAVTVADRKDKGIAGMLHVCRTGGAAPRD
ncbi:hypothetical protein [uncultured Sphingomonas sp.]|uniref:hypothetical protein n=1 Tax=uncultured Sphingomonas sp. TaxID=158754 RepID=UPI0025DF6A97|nr:hypothetical protein [uncultured Sphingomonas sp.]